GLVLFLRNRPASLALSKFNQIEPGMTRKQVWQLMEAIPEAGSFTGNSLDEWGFGQHFVIVVRFDPDEPGKPDERDPKGDNWKVTKVLLLDFSRPNPIQDFLKRFGLWRSPDRSKP